MKPMTKQDLPSSKEWADSGFNVPAELCSDQPTPPMAGHTPRTDMHRAEPIGFYSCATVPASLAHDLEIENNRLARENLALREALACVARINNHHDYTYDQKQYMIESEVRSALALPSPSQSVSTPKPPSDAATGTPEGKEGVL